MVDLKGTIRIDEQFAKSCPRIQLPCLRCDYFNHTQWISKANALVQLCDLLINSPSNVFWSSLVLRPQIHKELDHALENLPFLSDIEEGGIFVNAEIGPQLTELYTKILAVCLRITANHESEGVNSTTFRQLVQQNRILTFHRFRFYCGLYVENYFTSFKKIVGRLRQTTPEMFRQYDEDLQSFLMTINAIHESIALMNGKGVGGEMRRFEQVCEFYIELHRQTREVLSWCSAYRVMPDLRPNKQILTAIPALMEDLNESLGDHVLTNLAAGSSQLLIALCKSINHLKQALTKLYVRFYENYVDEFDKINLLSMLIESPELMSRVADKLHNQIDTLLQKSKLNDMVKRIRTSIDQANAKKSREIIESLREQGILANLGIFNSPEIEVNVEELTSLFPYTKEFAHLALRFYGYDHETTLAKLLDPDNLPFQLRILIKDTSLLPSAEPIKSSVMHVDDMYQESDIESEPEDMGNRGKPIQLDSDDLVALLTAAPKAKEAEKKPVLSAREQRIQKTQGRLQKLMDDSSDTLDMTNLQYLVDKMKKEEEKRAEETVQIGGKTFQKYYRDDLDAEIDQKDKEILRQKLEDYKYEDEDVDENEEYRKFKLEQQFEREVGMSGKFNRGYGGVTIYDYYDDERNDELDDHGFELGEGITADEKSANEVKSVNPLGPLGMPKNSTLFPTKGNPNKKSQSYPHHRPIDLKKEPSQSDEEPTTSRQNPQWKNDKKPQQQSRPAPSKQPQQSKPAPNKQPQQQKGQKNNQEASEEPTQKRKDGYTGGKGRMRKEQHKGKFKQQGADRKLAKANPF